MKRRNQAATCRGPAPIHRRATPQRGFTLIEALIALVVLSIGLLGVAKLVTSAVHADDSAYMRGQATQLAYEMLDQVRANRPGAMDGGYAMAPAYTDCSSTSCTDDTLAQLDLYNWQATLTQSLPSGIGAVTITTDPNNDIVATIVVSWDDSLAQYAFGTSSSAPVPSLTTLTLESVL